MFCYIVLFYVFRPHLLHCVNIYFQYYKFYNIFLSTYAKSKEETWEQYVVVIVLVDRSCIFNSYLISTIVFVI